MSRCALIMSSLCLGAVLGCAPTFGPNAVNGITIYSPGAGNVDFSDAGIRNGLKNAGYQGDVATFVWTISFNPIIDQTLRFNAHIRAAQLADVIEDYIDKFPGRAVNIVGLSAGTGVSIWAIEDLKPGYKVDNVVLLGSSLSHDYDVSKALKHVRGRIFNYYSPNDPVLTLLMKPIGTIDGKLLTDGAGAVGLAAPSGTNRVVNIPWRPSFKEYGYHGNHTDATNARFVEKFISKHILTADRHARARLQRAFNEAYASPYEARASERDSTLLAGSPD